MEKDELGYYPTRHEQSDPTPTPPRVWPPDRSTALQHLRTDFNLLKAKGVNCIRVVGFDLVRIAQKNPNTGEWFYNENTWANYYGNPPTFIPENERHEIIDAMVTVLDIAAEIEDFKVILLIGGHNMHFPGKNGVDFQSKINDYLADIASDPRINGSSALLAYDLINEPHNNVANDLYSSKLDLCEVVNTWIGTIKENDPDHLITLDLFDQFSVTLWDPVRFDIDFVSWHAYHYLFWESENSDVVSGFPYFNMMLPYYSLKASYYKSVNVPYMVTEAGLSVDQDLNPSTIDEGSELDQRNFITNVENIFNRTQTQGYLIWFFKDRRPAQILNAENRFGRFDYYGLLPRQAGGYSEFNYIAKDGINSFNQISYLSTQSSLHQANVLSYPILISPHYQYNGFLYSSNGNTPLKNAAILLKTSSKLYHGRSNEYGYYEISTNELVQSIEFMAPNHVSLNFTSSSFSGFTNNFTMNSLSGAPCGGVPKAFSQESEELVSERSHLNPDPDKLMIYPNPTEGQLEILLPSRANGSRNIKVSVFDLNGQLKIEGLASVREGSSAKLDFSALQKGIYILKVEDDNEIKTEKIIIR